MDEICYFMYMAGLAIEKSASYLDDDILFPKPGKDDTDSKDGYYTEDEDEDAASNDAEDSVDGSSVSSEDSEETEEEEKKISTQVVAAWEKRKKPVNSDFAILGWMLCVKEEVMDDVRERMTGEHRDAAERVITKLFAHDVDVDINEKIDTFWNEHKDFCNKSGVFKKMNRWNVQDVKRGKSHLWHEKYSLPYTDVLGFVACRVTSKLLGIGCAERSWGDVKHLKTNKRAHLSGDKIEKQAVLYTHAG